MEVCAPVSTFRPDRPDEYPWPGDAAVRERLRAALAHTDEEPPRPICPIELPAGLHYLLKPGLLRRLNRAAVLVPIVEVDGELRVVLTLRASHLRAHGAQVSFPGGRQESGDATLAATALREAQEEIGLDPARVEVIGYLDDYPTVSRFLITPVVALVDHPGQWRPDPREVETVFELPLQRVLRPRSFRRRLFSREGLKVPYFELQYQGFRIWGATAGMLWNLNRKVHDERE